ncbi:MAG TPA: DivIVA domain-containing protein [Solirubrobacteraceae bacterium]
MSYFQRPDAGLDQSPATTEDPPRSPFVEVAGRFANWISGADRMVADQPQVGEPYDRDPIRRLIPEPAATATTAATTTASATAAEPAALADEPSPFPLAAFGYNRAAVDEHLLGLERELAELRERHQPVVSITEELERIGEQTASILVVAHDKARETTRLAQEQADHCVADAAANAVAITAQAKERLAELDGETDSVWRERDRLLQDVRVVSAQLASLADEASDRFPAAEQSAGWQATVTFPMAFGPEPAESDDGADASPSGDGRAPSSQSGDTGSWLAGFEPPDQQ